MPIPTILITNDDGIHAKGLRSAIEYVKDLGEITVVAPDTPQSGMSMAITTEMPLKITPHPDFMGAKMYSVSGTPVDCVKLGLYKLLPVKPDIVISGINHGSNSGNSVLYSGTMGAVIEGCTRGIPSVGFSLLDHHHDADFGVTCEYVRLISSRIVSNGLPEGVCLNVNFPASIAPKGLKVCTTSLGYWTDEYEEQTDPTGRPVYWLAGHYRDLRPDDPSTDNYWLDRQWATAVPITPDMTAVQAIDLLRPLLETPQ